MHRSIFLLLLALAQICFLCSWKPSIAWSQLTVLSSGNVNIQWRGTQLELIKKQLDDATVKGPLRDELESQHQWLSNWKPGSLTEAPTWEQKDYGQLLTEPMIDPNDLAAPLRAKLFGENAKPTAADTNALHVAIQKHGKDLGLRQLHLHWLDQKQYRKEYTAEIVQSARELATMLEQVQPQTEELKLARGFCYYRLCRSLVYRESPEVVAQAPIADAAAHEAQLLGAYSQLVDLLGKNRPEFILIEVRMLRRDNWFGQALVMLEKYGSVIEHQWYLKKRRDLLKDLGWSIPSRQAADLYAAAFPEAVVAEQAETAGR